MKNNVAEDLKLKLEECRKQLLEVLDQLYFMQNELEPKLNFIYDSYFGELEEELQSKSLAAQELTRRIELFSKKINRGEKLTDATIEFINSIVDREFARKKNPYDANCSFGAQNFNQISNLKYDKNNFNSAKIYRALVKKLHPDIAGESENFKKFWNKVQDAYKNNDSERIFLFAKALCPEELIVEQEQTNEDIMLKKEIFELEQAIQKERRKLDRLKQQEPFVLEDSLNDRAWVMRRSRKLREQLFRVDSEIRLRENRLKMITSRNLYSAFSAKVA